MSIYMSLWCCGTFCTSEMLPLRGSAIPPGAWYCLTSNWLVLGTLFLFRLVPSSCSMALFRGYYGPLDLYPEFYRTATDPTIHSVPEGQAVNVCKGKKWYRFPSSFLLPNNWQLQFIPSQFRGQLPEPFPEGTLAYRLFLLIWMTRT